MSYDSTEDTLLHIRTVKKLLDHLTLKLVERGLKHDASKLESPEKEAYDKFTPRLKGLTYGSDEYKACLEEMRPTLKHHYAHNAHHPESHKNGVNDMTLLDITEMLSDWMAATLRVADGDILKSLEINRVRFGLSDQMYQILYNTVIDMGWSTR